MCWSSSCSLSQGFLLSTIVTVRCRLPIRCQQACAVLCNAKQRLPIRCQCVSASSEALERKNRGNRCAISPVRNVRIAPLHRTMRCVKEYGVRQLPGCAHPGKTAAHKTSQGIVEALVNLLACEPVYRGEYPCSTPRFCWFCG